MLKNKFYKNLFNFVTFFAAVMILAIILLMDYFESLKHGKNMGWKLPIISLSLIALFFLIGFYWIFQKVIIDENGIKIIFINKVIRKHKWEEIVTIKEAYIKQNPALRINLAMVRKFI